ncbi:MAG: hypothetical protein KGH54_04255, partial [Candidatus Micrarchaeota archaeon]|nr:hypothetical protein [Candidatus Micrarchaeota archaeon]
GLSMYYQTASHKPIISGYTSRVNETELLPSLTMPLTVGASYLQSGQGFVYPSPIIENYTNVTLFWMVNYKSAFVSIIRQAYSTSELTTLGSYLVSVFGLPSYQDNTTIVFSTQNATSHFRPQIVSYTAGTWASGYNLCANQFSCNATFGSLWWGPNVRAIDIYSANDTTVNMNFSAASYTQSSAPLIFYLNSPTNQVASFNLNAHVNGYSATLSLSKGINQLFLVTANNTAAVQGNPYLNFGIKNVTFQR